AGGGRHAGAGLDAAVGGRLVAAAGGEMGAQPDRLADAAAGDTVMDQPHVAPDGPAADPDRAAARPHPAHPAARRGDRFLAAGIADTGTGRADDAGPPDIRPVRHLSAAL